MAERLVLTPVQARMALLNEVFGTHTDLALAITLHGRGNNWRWYDEENGPDRLQREQAILADAQRSAMLVAGADNVLATTFLSDRVLSSIRLRLGFDGQGIKTFAEIGKELGGVTGSRARQIYVKAIKRLRHPVRSKGLNQFFP